MLNEIEASQISDTEFEAMVIRKLIELTENYQKLQGNYKEFTANYINMKKEIETINKGREEMKNTICELKNTVETIKSRLGDTFYFLLTMSLCYFCNLKIIPKVIILIFK